MNNKIYQFSLVLFLLLFSACNHSCDKNCDPKKCKGHTENVSGSHDHGDDGHHHEATNDLGITLNDGKVWEANTETTEGIAALSKILADYNAAETKIETVELQKSLTDEFQLIFKKCTMTGEAHDQLHKYLIPIKGMLAGMNTDDATKLKISIDNLDKHLNTYSTYFK